MTGALLFVAVIAAGGACAIERRRGCFPFAVHVVLLLEALAMAFLAGKAAQ